MISYKEGSSYFSATLLRYTGLQKICEPFAEQMHGFFIPGDIEFH
jgi:hypothetical protein